MANPFEKRATEYLRDEAAFLSVVTPEPLNTFFKKHAVNDTLFDRLCMVIGNPGSGKTTIAKLIQFNTVHTLIHSPNHTEYRPIQKSLLDCKIISNERISFLACRIPMESEYRQFWELPYEKEIKLGLLKSFLQSRAMILWISSLRDIDKADLTASRVQYRDGSAVASDSLGGDNLKEILDKAIEIEREIYNISAALVPPSLDKISAKAKEPYHPFDAIEKFIVMNGLLENTYRPLVIFDDVHSLHYEQIFNLRDWLAKREMKISRWLLMRLDAQTPENILDGFSINSGVDNESTIKNSREITFIWLQGSEDRRVNRQNFTTMAKSMADKYLGLMPVFNKQGIKSFQDILSTDVSEIADSKYKDLLRKISSLQDKYGIGDSVRKKYELEIEDYIAASDNPQFGKDIKLAMLYIILNRYIVRAPQKSLFDSDVVFDPAKPIKANSGIADGARIFLLHQYDKPYYYGIDALCNGSSENAEQFLQLAGRLADASEKRIIQGKSSILSADYQHKLLFEKSEEVVRDWNFPKNQDVKKLCEMIASDCIAKSLEPNASLNGGANAIGIPEEDFCKIPVDYPDIAQILKFGIAYGALSIKRRHSTKNILWTLIELTGPFLITKKLTFTRGGFLEKDMDYILSLVGKKYD